jgi:hypothetical protein
LSGWQSGIAEGTVEMTPFEDAAIAAETDYSDGDFD